MKRVLFIFGLVAMVLGLLLGVYFSLRMIPPTSTPDQISFFDQLGIDNVDALSCTFKVSIEPVFEGLPESTYPSLYLYTDDQSIEAQDVEDGQVIRISSKQTSLYVAMYGEITKNDTPIMSGIYNGFVNMNTCLIDWWTTGKPLQ